MGLCDSKELKRRAGKADQSRGRPIRLPSGDRSLGAVAARCRNIRGFHFVLHAHGYVEWTSDGAYATVCIVGYEELHWGARDIARYDTWWYGRLRSEARRAGLACVCTHGCRWALDYYKNNKNR